MSEQVQSETSLSPLRLDAESEWGLALVGMRCPQCDWHYLGPPSASNARCPHCFGADLMPVETLPDHKPYHPAPEILLPFQVPAATANERITDFAKDIPFAPYDLEADTLRARAQRIYLPVWLVDGDVQAVWDAEAGFDYEVVSHRERYADGGGWNTEETRETRIRWEPRAGQLARHYDNIIAPALESHAALQHALGSYPKHDAQAYSPDKMAGILVRLPDRPPQAAWSDAVPAFRSAAAKECRQAASADHIRRFRWQPAYANRNWTLLLLPVYATYYLDDAGEPQAVLVNGCSGQISGKRRASMQRAQRTSLVISVIAALLFALGLCLGVTGLAVPPLIIVGIVVALAAFVAGIVGASIPIIRASRFNKQVSGSPDASN